MFDPDGSAYTREGGAARDAGVAGSYGSELFDPDGQQYDAPDPAAGDESIAGRGQGSSALVSSRQVGAEHPRSAPMQVPETTTQTEPRPEDIQSLIREIERLPEQDRVVVLAAFRRALDAVAGRVAEAIGPSLPQLPAKDEAAFKAQGRRISWDGSFPHRTDVFEEVLEPTLNRRKPIASEDNADDPRPAPPARSNRQRGRRTGGRPRMSTAALEAAAARVGDEPIIDLLEQADPELAAGVRAREALRVRRHRAKRDRAPEG